MEQVKIEREKREEIRREGGGTKWCAVRLERPVSQLPVALVPTSGAQLSLFPEQQQQNEGIFHINILSVFISI